MRDSLLVYCKAKRLVVRSFALCFNQLRVRILTYWGPDKLATIFADDMLKWIFLTENIWFSIKSSLKFVPKGPNSNIPTLAQIMAWRRSGDTPLCEPMMVTWPTHIWVTRPLWFKKQICIQFWISYISSTLKGHSYLKSFYKENKYKHRAISHNNPLSLIQVL